MTEARINILASELYSGTMQSAYKYRSSSSDGNYSLYTREVPLGIIETAGKIRSFNDFVIDGDSLYSRVPYISGLHFIALNHQTSE